MPAAPGSRLGRRACPHHRKRRPRPARLRPAMCAEPTRRRREQFLQTFYLQWLPLLQLLGVTLGEAATCKTGPKTREDGRPSLSDHWLRTVARRAGLSIEVASNREKVSKAVALGGAWGEAIDGTFGRVGVYFFCSALTCHPNVRSLERSHHRPSAAISGAWRRAPWRSQSRCSLHATSTRSRLSILCSFGMMLRRVNIFAPQAGIGHKREPKRLDEPTRH